MKYTYFLDTEFVDDGSTIDLISIALVCREDGREYYAQSVEFDETKASDWVKENVLRDLPLCPCCGHRYNHVDQPTGKCRHKLCMWRNREQIKKEILAFMSPAHYGQPELWAWYASYDFVAFCQLFGRMKDLPQGFPEYICDLRQWCNALGNPRLPRQESGKHHALEDARWNRDIWQVLNELETERRKG